MCCRLRQPAEFKNGQPNVDLESTSFKKVRELYLEPLRLKKDERPTGFFPDFKLDLSEQQTKKEIVRKNRARVEEASGKVKDS